MTAAVVLSSEQLKSISCLTVGESQAYHLRFAQNKTYAMMAKEMGLPVSKVKCLLQKACYNIKKVADDKDYLKAKDIIQKVDCL